MPEEYGIGYIQAPAQSFCGISDVRSIRAVGLDLDCADAEAIMRAAEGTAAEIPIEQAGGKYVCSVCGCDCDPAENDGIAFEDLPEDWKCPRCKQGKDKFYRA